MVEELGAVERGLRFAGLPIGGLPGVRDQLSPAVVVVTEDPNAEVG